MSVLKRLIEKSCASAPRLVRRYFQTGQTIESEPATASVVQGLESLAMLPGKEQISEKIYPIEVETKVADILHDIKSTDGLPVPPSHVEHLIGRATKGRIYQKHMLEEQEVLLSSACGERQYDFSINNTKIEEKYEAGGIDIAEKTQLILQSPHPVRYVIERELYNSQQGLHLRLPTYHTWIMIFGRSLFRQKIKNENEEYDKLLDYVANASDAGMFSADIHHTIIDIPENHPTFYNCSSLFHMGNKYAVLVGDYFAIRCIYYAERTKTNSVMVAITEGVEEFTTSTFGTNLLDKRTRFPQMLSPNASVHDWILYSQKAFGYFKGGLYAAFSLVHNSHTKDQHLEAQMAKFVANFSAFLKACGEIESLEQTDLVVPSPFLLTSLPAVLCQMENPAIFSRLRTMSYELNSEHIREVHEIIRKSPLCMKRSRNLVLGLAEETKQTLRRIANDSHYLRVFDSLVDSVVTKI